jgi:hypothetical protein
VAAAVAAAAAAVVVVVMAAMSTMVPDRGITAMTSPRGG